MELKPKLLSLIEGKKLSAFSEIFNFYQYIRGEELYKEHHRLIQVEYDGKIYFVVEEIFEETPTGAVFKLLNEPLSNGEVEETMLSWFGEIAGKWYGGTKENEDEQKSEIVEIIHKWWLAAGQEEMQEMKKHNPQEYTKLERVDKIIAENKIDEIEKENEIHESLYSVKKFSAPDYFLSRGFCDFVTMVLLHIGNKLAGEIKEEPTIEKFKAAVSSVFKSDLAVSALNQINKQRNWDGLVFKQSVATKMLAEHNIFPTNDIIVAMTSLLQFISSELISLSQSSAWNCCRQVLHDSDAKCEIIYDRNLRETLEDLKADIEYDMEHVTTKRHKIIFLNDQGEKWSKQDSSLLKRGNKDAREYYGEFGWRKNESEWGLPQVETKQVNNGKQVNTKKTTNRKRENKTMSKGNKKAQALLESDKENCKRTVNMI